MASIQPTVGAHNPLPVQGEFVPRGSNSSWSTDRRTAIKTLYGLGYNEGLCRLAPGTHSKYGFTVVIPAGYEWPVLNEQYEAYIRTLGITPATDRSRIIPPRSVPPGQPTGSDQTENRNEGNEGPDDDASHDPTRNQAVPPIPPPGATSSQTVVPPIVAAGAAPNQNENANQQPAPRAGQTLVSFKYDTRRAMDGTGTKRNRDGSTVATRENAEIPAFIKDLMGPNKSLYLPAGKEKLITLIGTLNEINGQGAYSNEAQALGRLTAKEYLVLPQDQNTPLVPIEEVGTGAAKERFTVEYIMAVYALNKELGGTGEDAVKFGLARAEAVKLGWYTDQREVRMAPTPQNFIELVENDAELIEKFIPDAMLAAWLVPMCTEHTFRTLGHHYITGMATAYSARYSTLLKACLAGHIDKFMPDELLYHKAFHWISPGRIWNVLKAVVDKDLIPSAIQLRITAPPAGTAIVTTTAAIYECMQASHLSQCIEKYKLADVQKIRDMDKLIRQDPPKWHKVPTAYGRAGLTASEAEQLAVAKAEANKLAPICKAFVDVMLKGSPMARQKVLDKASNANPALYNGMRKYLQGYARHKPENVDAVFITSGESSAPRVEEAP